jgi:hypothetical protein
MNDTDKVKEKFENINTNFENDMEMAKLKAELKKKFEEYQTTMKFMLADAPVEALCLHPKIQSILLDQGFLRIYDLFDVDLVKVKGLGIVRIKELTARLDQFFSML